MNYRKGLSPLIVLIVANVVMLLSVLGALVADRWQEPTGVALPQGSAVYETSLQSRISSTDTSMTLTSVALRGSETVSGYNCFTIDEGRTDQEFVCGTVSGTTVSSLERGLSFANGTTSVTANKYTHRVGANVKISDYPLIQRIRNLANGVELFPNALLYQSHPCSVSSASNTICDQRYIEDYANNVIAGGSPTSTESLGGKVELATAAEQAASYYGGTDKPTVLQSRFASSTPSSPQSVSANTSLISDVTGYLAQAWLNLTEHFSFSSLFAMNASTTNATTTTQAITSVLSSLLKTDSAGNVQAAVAGTDYAKAQYTYASTTGTISANDAFATSTGFLTIPAGTLSASSSISVRGTVECEDTGGTPTLCNVFLRNSLGQQLAGDGVDLNTGVNTRYSFEILVVSNGVSTSAQKYYFNMTPLGNNSTVAVAGVNSAGTATVDLSQALTFAVVVQGQGAFGSARLLNYFITVNP